MQLTKYNWKKIRHTARFTQPVDGGYRCRRGGMQSAQQYGKQLRSRQLNPNDPQNALP